MAIYHISIWEFLYVNTYKIPQFVLDIYHNICANVKQKTIFYFDNLMFFDVFPSDVLRCGQRTLILYDLSEEPDERLHPQTKTASDDS